MRLACDVRASIDEVEAPYVELLRALNTAGVRYLIVGGLAVVLHGVPRMTFDLDMAVDPDDANMRALVSVLKGGGYVPRVPEPMERLADAAIRDRWRSEKNMIAFNVRHPTRRLEDVDVLLMDSVEWRRASADAETKSLHGMDVSVVGRQALIEMKRASGRPQDLADAEALAEASKGGDDETD
jgi:hypothetical protein